jgi:hypothetical protein
MFMGAPGEGREVPLLPLQDRARKFCASKAFVFVELRVDAPRGQ